MNLTRSLKKLYFYSMNLTPGVGLVKLRKMKLTWVKGNCKKKRNQV